MAAGMAAGTAAGMAAGMAADLAAELVADLAADLAADMAAIVFEITCLAYLVVCHQHHIAADYCLCYSLLINLIYILILF